MQVPSHDGAIGEHTSTYRRDRKNLTKFAEPPHNTKELNDSRLRIAVDRFSELLARLELPGTTGSLQIEVTSRYGLLKDPITNLRIFHRC